MFDREDFDAEAAHSTEIKKLQNVDYQAVGSELAATEELLLLVGNLEGILGLSLLLAAYQRVLFIVKFLVKIVEILCDLIHVWHSWELLFVVEGVQV